MHRAFCESTGDSPPYIGCERRLRDFEKQGFAEDDIRLVVWFVKRENAKMHGAKWGIGFGQLFQQSEGGIFERFCDLLGMARGARRANDFKAKHSYSAEKASVLRATGRSDTPPIPEGCITAHEAIRRLRESV